MGSEVKGEAQAGVNARPSWFAVAQSELCVTPIQPSFSNARVSAPTLDTHRQPGGPGQ